MSFSGQSFAPGGTISVFLDDGVSVSELPALMTSTDASGDFDAVLTVDGVEAGDHVVSVFDDQGNLAIGIVTYGDLLFADGFESGDMELWSGSSP